MNVEAAGVGVAKAQRAITRQREQKRLESLDARIRALPPADMRRAAWLNVDRNSTVWVTAWPTLDGYLSNPELAEVATWYFGLPNPACGPLVGQRIAFFPETKTRAPRAKCNRACQGMQRHRMRVPRRAQLIREHAYCPCVPTGLPRCSPSAREAAGGERRPGPIQPLRMR